MDTTDLKIINYRGGVVRFRIPTDWEEEYEEDGGGTFYQARSDSGTLRLNILTFEAPADTPVAHDAEVEMLAPDATKFTTEVVRLRDGVAMIGYDEPSEERGERLMIRYWRILQVVPPDHVRIAVFSYALLNKQFTDPAYIAELELLDREIRAAEFSSELGMTASPKKPWWRPW